MKTLLKRFFGTDDAWTGLIIRVMLGLVMLPHGTQKLLGWFGGYGFSGTMGAFTGQMHIPWVLAFLVIMGESFGALGLIAGFLTRFSAFGLFCIMLGAIFMVHLPNGFFSKDGGFEYHLLVISMSVALMISGAGRWSVDRLIAGKLKEEST